MDCRRLKCHITAWIMNRHILIAPPSRKLIFSRAITADRSNTLTCTRAHIYVIILSNHYLFVMYLYFIKCTAIRLCFYRFWLSIIHPLRIKRPLSSSFVSCLRSFVRSEIKFLRSRCLYVHIYNINCVFFVVCYSLTRIVNPCVYICLLTRIAVYGCSDIIIIVFNTSIMHRYVLCAKRIRI